ncbi:hypothetical protein AAFF_G00305830 [Aldrovandia affinis]|uniref:Uncharacterized protein n=1 Tax=Aldrovandia affinis TaxID=143900 RepID=A0AAD7SP97_9TELE|nr:hypothetical protein AAFF_G00305830 [Aldrovandia affinis]
MAAPEWALSAARPFNLGGDNVPRPRSDCSHAFGPGPLKGLPLSLSSQEKNTCTVTSPPVPPLLRALLRQPLAKARETRPLHGDGEQNANGRPGLARTCSDCPSRP